MRVIAIVLLTIINIAVQGQAINIKRPVDFSPDKNFGLLITIGGVEGFPEWKYWIMNNKNDTILLTTTITHDEFPPVTFWSKSSKEIIFEDQTRENNNNQIKIYNLIDNRIEFETPGFIWGHGNHNFDKDHGLLFYFKKADNTNDTFDLMVLNIDSRKIKKLNSVATSGDPLTGAPEIESIDTIKNN